MIRPTSVSLRVLTIALIGALLISGCNGSLSLDGGLDLNGGGGSDGDGDNGSSISQNQLLTVLVIVLLVVALVGILR